MDKFAVAREQLITALDLFLNDQSPVSVHTLAGAAREVLEVCCRRQGVEPFVEHIKRTYPSAKAKELYSIMNEYRNAFKHYADNDEDVIENFSDEKNEHLIFIALQDYHSLVKKSTVPMQIFEAWYYATYPDKLVPEKIHYSEYFSKIRKAPRAYQKLMVRKTIAEARCVIEIIVHPETELD